MSDPNYNEVTALISFDDSPSPNYGDVIDNSKRGSRGWQFAVNGSLSATARFGAQGMFCNGDEGHLGNVGAETLITDYTGQATVEFWVQFQSWLDFNPVLHFGTAADNNDRFQIDIRNSGADISVFNDSGTNNVTALPSSLNLAQWYHFAFVLDGGNYEVYIDGVLAQSGSTSAWTPSSNDVRIGYGFLSSNNQGSDAFYDEIRITDGVARYTAPFTPPAAAFPQTSDDTTAARYDPASAINCAVSQENQRHLKNATSSVASVKGDVVKQQGDLFAIEWQVVEIGGNTFNGQTILGITTEAIGDPVAEADTLSIRSDGQVRNFASSAAGGITFNDGDIVTMCYDNGDVWWGVNGVFIAGGDPEAGTTPTYSGVVFPNPDARAVYVSGSQATRSECIMNAGQYDFVHVPPRFLDGMRAPIGVTFDPTQTNANLSLTENNLRVSRNLASWGTTFSTTSRSSGKYAFEIENINVDGGSSLFGFGGIAETRNLADGFFAGFSADSWGATLHGGGFFNNNVFNADANIVFGTGDTVMVLADIDTGEFSVIDPDGVTQRVGYSGQGFAGQEVWAAVSLFGLGTDVRANFGASPFVNTLPMGFLAWDSSATVPVTGTFEISWDVINPVQVAGTFDISWDVDSALAQVAGTFDISWDLQATVAGTFDIAWQIDSRVGPADFEISWNVEQALERVNGEFSFLWQIEQEQEICRAYRAIRERESFWKGFPDKSAVMTRGPLVNDQYYRYYIVQDGDVPRYTTYEVLELERRIRAQLVDSTYYRLGVPQPQTAPSVVPSGGNPDLTVDRSYVYTWVSAFGEEGPPSNPTVVSGADDGDWTISNFDVDVPFADERLISNIRVYRTVTSTLGTVEFHFVADLDFSDVSFVDNIPTSTVGSNFTLESETFFPPPEGLQNLVEHPNGFFIGNVGRDIYMSEPYRPHAWNPENVLSTLGDIVGFGIFGTSVVVCTESFPYVMSGISPSSMVLTQSDTAEPCLSRYGIVSMPSGVYFPGPNGLILVNSRGFNTVTEGLMTKEEWQARYDPANIDAARYQNSYVAFYSNTDGFLFTPTDQLYTFVELNTFFDNCGIQTDEYSGKTLLCTGTELYEWNPPTGANVQYVWESKEFDVADPVNFSAFRIIWYGDPVPTEEQIQDWRNYNAERIQNPLGPVNWHAVNVAKKDYVPAGVSDAPEWNQPIGGPVLYRVPEIGEPWPGTDTLTAEFFANDRLVHTKIIDNDGMFRLPSGFKATRWRVRLTGSVKVKSVKIAETGKELARV